MGVEQWVGYVVKCRLVVCTRWFVLWLWYIVVYTPFEWVVLLLTSHAQVIDVCLVPNGNFFLLYQLYVGRLHHFGSSSISSFSLS